MITLWSLFVLAVVCICCALAGVGLYVFNTGIEHRRSAAGVIAVTLAKYGLLKLSNIFHLYSIGDYSGFIIAMVDLSKEVFDSPDAFLAELEGAFDHVLEAKMADPKEMAWLKTQIANAEAPKVAA